jgi:hypothetical protein
VRAVSPDWIFELGELAERYALSLPSIRSLTTDLAFAAREFNQRVPNEQDWERVSPASPKRRLVLAYVHGQRMRWDSQFEELRSSCRRWRQEFGADALIIGLEAVAALGLRHPEASTSTGVLLMPRMRMSGAGTHAWQRSGLPITFRTSRRSFWNCQIR